MKRFLAVIAIASCALSRPQVIEAQAPAADVEITQKDVPDIDPREAANARDAQAQEGRWDPLDDYIPTPDHIDQEKADDEISEHFDEFCDVIYAESGNQGEYGMRLVADVIINRMRSGEAFADTMNGVLNAPGQFSCIKDGHAAGFKGHTKASVRRIAQEELKQVKDATIFYFRTGHFTQYGTPAYKYKDVYFSRRK